VATIDGTCTAVVYNAAAVLYMYCYFLHRMFYTFTLILSEVAVQCPKWLLSAVLMMCSPGDAAQVLTERFREGSSYDNYNCHYRFLWIQLLCCLINYSNILLFVLFATYVSYLLMFVICFCVVLFLCCVVSVTGRPCGCWIGTLIKIKLTELN
jgi:hypothetical protein